MSTSSDVQDLARGYIVKIRAATQATVNSIEQLMKRINDLETTGDRWRATAWNAEVKAIRDALAALGIDATDWDGTVGGPTPAP